MSILILLILLLYFFIDFKKGTIIILLLMPLLSIVHLAGQGLNLWLGLVIVLKWLIISKDRWNAVIRSGFCLSVVLMSFSYLISNYYASVQHFPSVVANIIQLLLIFVLADYLKTYPKLNDFALKSVIVIATILSINGLIETLTRYNILLNVAIGTGLYSPSTPVITEVRYGLKRAQSAFAMHTSWGGYCFLAFCFLFYLKKYCKITFRYSNVLLILLGANLFFTGTRSAFLGFLVALLTFIDVKDFKRKKVWGLILLVIALSPLFLGYFSDVASSITDTSKVSGSSSDMREAQFDICFYYLSQSPWIGNGIAYTWEYVLPQNKDLLGAESLWIPVLIDQGWLGALAVSVIFIASAWYLYKHYSLKYCFVVVGFLVFNSMSSIPNIHLTDFVYYIILLCTFTNRIPKNERTITKFEKYNISCKTQKS